ncbi:MAG: type IA DNA topoisomerase [Clostridia bacterium]|nr:type IA DNA topoisomerase [Clostridia bacterium]
MAKKLLITEKPSVATEFAKALKINTARKNGYVESEEYVITWCVGHLVTMSYPEVYDEKYKAWRFDTLPFIPSEWKYEVIASVQNQFDIVKSLLTRDDVDTIYVCTDSGREGEYIYRLVDEMVGVQGKSKKRVWIDSQTEEEILKGINTAKDLSEYDALADSAYLRAKEDYLIGINFSRLLTLSYGRKLAEFLGQERAPISVGRVMTCVLGMVVSREMEIRNFAKTNFYKVQASLEDGLIAEWKYDEKNENNFNELKDIVDSNQLYNDNGFKKEEDAKAFIEHIIKDNPVPKVLEASKKTQKENAPLLYNLAEIQNECSKKFKISPDQTLEVIQLLYEKKLVTYPRTDARVLSTAVAKEINKNLNGLAKWGKDEEIKNILNSMIQNKYSTDIVKSKYVNDSKITDHYALIPTGQGFENYDSLQELHKSIYKLIVKRFLSIFFPPAEFTKLAITIDIGGQKFYANSKVCTKQGYLEVINTAQSTPSSEERSGEQSAPSQLDSSGEQCSPSNKSSELKIDGNALSKIKKGQTLNLLEINTKEGETSPPSRYSSGSIILAMENAGKLIEDERLREQIKGSGIGTSATRAEIIKKLNRIGYIDINPKTQILTPSQKGEQVYKAVSWSIPDMLNPDLTASWEKGLDMVARKEIKPDEFMLKLEAYIKAKTAKLKR